jgi:uncharacterized protein (DUF1810 family)
MPEFRQHLAVLRSRKWVRGKHVTATGGGGTARTWRSPGGGAVAGSSTEVTLRHEGKPLLRSHAVPPPVFDLDRFKLAQDRHGSFAGAMAELRSGKKTTHWIWWVFPQVAGLGMSATSVRYALSGRGEAGAYLADDVLRARLLEAVAIVHEQLLEPPKRRIDGTSAALPRRGLHLDDGTSAALPRRGPQLAALMGSEVDALKLVSSMTLFAEVARDADVCDLPDTDRLQKMAVQILEAARGAGYAACAHTLAALQSSPP